MNLKCISPLFDFLLFVLMPTFRIQIHERRLSALVTFQIIIVQKCANCTQ